MVESQEYSRFWGVIRGWSMSDVLGALEHAICQTCQKVSGWEQTCNRTQLKPCAFCQLKTFYKALRLWIHASVFRFHSFHRLHSDDTFKEAWHVFQLGNVVWTVAAVLLQQTKGLEVLFAGVGDVQVPKGRIDLTPRWNKTKRNLSLLKQKFICFKSEDTNWSVKMSTKLTNWYTVSSSFCLLHYFHYILHS